MTFHLKPFSLFVALIITGVFFFQSGIVDPVYWDELLKRTEQFTSDPASNKSQLIPEQKVKPVVVERQSRLTFFETLNDPSLNKFVGMNGKVRRLPRTEAEPVSAIPRLKAKPHPPQKKRVNEIKPEVAKKIVSNPAPPPALDHTLEPLQVRVQQEIKGTFSVQVGSFNTIDAAIHLQRRLRHKGYPTFILTANVPGKRSLWYRVYLGRFASPRIAEMAARRVRNEEKLVNVIHVAGK